MVKLTEGMPVHVNDMACVSHEWSQYRFPKQKSHRKVKKWAKNQKNYRAEEVHRVYEVQGALIVSTKIFEQLKNLTEYEKHNKSRTSKKKNDTKAVSR